jgi:23S rRNA (guanosine2251-2'-O)-methyltransferase
MLNSAKKMTHDDVIYGIHPVLEALRSGQHLDRALLKRGLDRETAQMLETCLKERGIPFQYVPAEKLNRLVRGQHQGIAAFVSLIEYSDLEEILIAVNESGGIPLVLLLDGITDVRNFGAIARSAECAGVHAIVVPSHGSAQIGGDAMKTSAGALNYLPVCRFGALTQAVKMLHSYGINVVAASENAAAAIYDVPLHLPAALILGAESSGIAPALLRASDMTAKIPMHGRIQSLNVSAAASIMLFEAGRQRKMHR